VSSEKREMTSDAGGAEGNGNPWCVGTATAVMGSYRPLSVSLAVVTRAANTARLLRAGTPARSCLQPSLLEESSSDTISQASRTT
jgi:hypothetical protein